jgi:hypothetical protein
MYVPMSRIMAWLSLRTRMSLDMEVAVVAVDVVDVEDMDIPVVEVVAQVEATAVIPM